MRLLVLAALAAVGLADAGQLTSYRYNTPASSYGVPQNSVTENFLNAVPTSPSPGLNLPILEHQNFNQAAVVSTTPAPIVDSGIIISTTSAPSLSSGIVSTTSAPSLNSGFSFTTPAPALSLNSGGLGIQSIGGLPSIGAGIISSTPAPNLVVTSGSQELLNPPLTNLGFNSGLGIFSTPAPIITSTPVPSIGLNSGLNLGSGFNFPQLNTGYNFGLSGFPTPLPINLGTGGSLSDAFGVSTPGPIISPNIAVSYQSQNQPAQVSKHVYFYAAPEEPELPRPRINILPVAPPKQNVRILFIKAPSPPSPGPIRIAAPPQDEEKTVVYVLVKKPEEQQDIEIQSPPPTPPSKPEVFFIKYKSQHEAEQAISQIQNGHVSTGPQIIADTVNGGDIVTSINRESLATSLPIINYIQSTTPAPPLNIVGGPIGGIAGPSFNINPLSEADISNNLIPSGFPTSSILSTAAPVTVSSGEIGLIGTSTVTPIAPHPTYGPPLLKK